VRCGRTREACDEGVAARCAEPAWRPCHGDRWAKVCEEYLCSLDTPDYLAAVADFERVTKISGVCREQLR
jgi:hypothetical protein